MEKFLFNSDGMTEQEKIELLNAHCVECIEDKFERPFTLEELAEMKDHLPERLTTLMEKKAELKALSDTVKGEMKITTAAIDRLVTNITNKSEEVTEKLWLVDNQENSTMEYYDINGRFIKSRPLLPKEKQLRITHSQSSNS